MFRSFDWRVSKYASTSYGRVVDNWRSRRALTYFPIMVILSLMSVSPRDGSDRKCPALKQPSALDAMRDRIITIGFRPRQHLPIENLVVHDAVITSGSEYAN
jgi:hypothetical protein